MAKTNKILSLIVLAFFAIYVIWGSTYLLNRLQVTELQRIMLAECALQLLVIYIWEFAKNKPYTHKITARQFINTPFAGFLFLTLGNVFCYGPKICDSGCCPRVQRMPLI